MSSAYSSTVASCIWDYYRLKRLGEKCLSFYFSSRNCSCCVISTTLGLTIQMAWKDRLHWWLLSGPSQYLSHGCGDPMPWPSTAAPSRAQHQLFLLSLLCLSTLCVSEWVCFSTPEREVSNLVSVSYPSSNVCPLVPSEWANSFSEAVSYKVFPSTKMKHVLRLW